jgi:carboxypeptidase C (cathepsin A)
LKFGGEMTYKPRAEDAGDWDLKHRTGPGWDGTYTNVSKDLADTLKQNPSMHVLLMGGYYDLGTLYFAATYEMKHLPIPNSLEKNIEYKFFPTGHMVYVKPDVLRELHDRTAAFIGESVAGQ